jgi:thioredoxin reductase
MIHQLPSLLQINKRLKNYGKSKSFSLVSKRTTCIYQQGDTMTVEYENLQTKERHTISADGYIGFIGMQPNTLLFGNQLQTEIGTI